MIFKFMGLGSPIAALGLGGQEELKYCNECHLFNFIGQVTLGKH